MVSVFPASAEKFDVCGRTNPHQPTTVIGWWGSGHKYNFAAVIYCTNLESVSRKPIVRLLPHQPTTKTCTLFDVPV